LVRTSVAWRPLALVAAVVVAVWVSGPARAVPSGTWTIVPAATVAGSVLLLDVAATSSTDAWAVGYSSPCCNHVRALVEHWDGAAWSRVATPTVVGDTVLSGVSATSAADAWAVGRITSSNGDRTLIEHWNGTSWVRTASPNPGTDNALSAVAATSSTDAWAVGSFVSADLVLSTLVEHWDGASWSVVPSPNIPNTNPSLTGVSALGGSDAWATGYANKSGTVDRTLVMHWDGSTWSMVPSPSCGGTHDYLLGVAAVAMDDAWAAGFCDVGTVESTLIERWDGSSWTRVPSAPGEPSPSRLQGVAAAGGSTWVVGDGQPGGVPPQRTLTEQWDGSSWSIAPSPNVGTWNNFLEGVAVIDSGEAWAVGYISNGVGTKALIEHYA